MRVGYMVQPMPQLASYRFRVQIPSRYVPSVIGATGNPTFFYKNGDARLAQSLSGGIVYDVVNDHFTGSNAQHYHAMCAVADVITCGSTPMAYTIRKYTGRDATVIDDPYENEEWAPRCDGEAVLWFGHSANISALKPYADLPNLIVCSNVNGAIQWTPQTEMSCLSAAAVVLLVGNNPGASSLRPVKALRAGRFVVTPGGVESWDALRDFIWVGDVREGIEYALNNREEVCKKIKAGQDWIRERFSPETIGRQWKELFASI